ncbi:sugar ABC transporter ATP-binding protein [Deinococcus sp.]|uniref:sugar ABC transporter ATP-binding protein n=1 Tax=Deinococcus sp. TaxID=47478 RepID=UPI003CC5C6CA
MTSVSSPLDSSAPPGPPLLSAVGVTKRYGSTLALSSAAIELRSGEVHALLGANGSGKSTLSKIIAGTVTPDAGTLTLAGQTVRFRSPGEARRAGIAVVYQELSLVPDLSVAQNIWLGHELGRGAVIDARLTRGRTAELLALLSGVIGAGVRPETPVAGLAPDERQLVELLKAVSLQPRLLILDEATASLDARQVDRVFELVREWKAAGMALVIVTHRMEEIFRAADRITVLRNGQVVGQTAVADTTRAALVGLISGEAAAALQSEGDHKNHAVTGTPALEVAFERRAAGGKLGAVRLAVQPGEIVGLGGLQGQGQAELLLSIFGALDAPGEVRLDGRAVKFRHPSEAIAAHLAYVPGDRNREGLLGSRSIFENFLAPAWSRFSRGGWLRLEEARRAAQAAGERLKLKHGGLELGIGSLSGGNAQKVVIGKWLLSGPRVLLLNDPTKGIDVGAKADFYHLLSELRAAGLAVLFYSSDDDELLGLCDRVLVMLDGGVAAELSGAGLSRAALVRASLAVAS